MHISHGGGGFFLRTLWSWPKALWSRFGCWISTNTRNMCLHFILNNKNRARIVCYEKLISYGGYRAREGNTTLSEVWKLCNEKMSLCTFPVLDCLTILTGWVWVLYNICFFLWFFFFVFFLFFFVLFLFSFEKCSGAKPVHRLPCRCFIYSFTQINCRVIMIPNKL